MSYYYALNDLQNGGLMHTGRNATSKAQLKEELLSYISVDFDENDPDWRAWQAETVEGIAEAWELEIVRQSTKFPEGI